MKYIKLFFFLVICFNTNSQITKLRTLFIGNSYTYTHNIPKITADFAASVGDTLYYGSNAIGNYTLHLHSTNSSTIGMIKNGNWDYVILQESAGILRYPSDIIDSVSYIYAYRLDSLINQYNSCGETMIYMPWGSKYDCVSLPEVCEINRASDSITRSRAVIMADLINAVISPVGNVWRYIVDHYPALELYEPDRGHPSDAGSYAAACCFYTVFFRKDPVKSAYNFKLNETDASNIRNAVKTVVYDSLSNWKIGVYQANGPCKILNSPTSHLTISGEQDTILLKIVSNTSWKIESKSEWISFNIDTGNNSNTIKVCIMANITDNVRIATLTLSNDNIVYQNITIVQTKVITNLSNILNAKVLLYPNPVTDKMIFTMEDMKSDMYLELLSLSGQVLYSSKIFTKDSEIDMRPFANGIYILKAYSEQGQYTGKIIKQ